MEEIGLPRGKLLQVYIKMAEPNLRDMNLPSSIILAADVRARISILESILQICGFPNELDFCGYFLVVFCTDMKETGMSY